MGSSDQPSVGHCLSWYVFFTRGVQKVSASLILNWEAQKTTGNESGSAEIVAQESPVPCVTYQTKLVLYQ